MTGMPFRPLALVVARPLRRRDCTPDESYIGEPCPYVTCKYHLAIDLKQTANALTIASVSPRFVAWVEDDAADPGPTCVLDLIENETRMGLTEIRALLGAGISQQRLNQIFHDAFDALPLDVVEHLRDTLLAS